MYKSCQQKKKSVKTVSSSPICEDCIRIKHKRKDVKRENKSYKHTHILRRKCTYSRTSIVCTQRICKKKKQKRLLSDAEKQNKNKRIFETHQYDAFQCK